MDGIGAETGADRQALAGDEHIDGRRLLDDGFRRLRGGRPGELHRQQPGHGSRADGHRQNDNAHRSHDRPKSPRIAQDQVDQELV